MEQHMLSVWSTTFDSDVCVSRSLHVKASWSSPDIKATWLLLNSASQNSEIGDTALIPAVVPIVQSCSVHEFNIFPIFPAGWPSTYPRAESNVVGLQNRTTQGDSSEAWPRTCSLSFAASCTGIIEASPPLVICWLGGCGWLRGHGVLAITLPTITSTCVQNCNLTFFSELQVKSNNLG